MRITLTTPALDGGIGRNLINLAAAWLDAGIEIDLLIDHRRDTDMSGLPAEVTVLESGGSHPISGIPWLVRYLRRRRPAGILTPVPRHTLWALRAKLISRVPASVVANVHNNYLMTLNTMRPSKQRSRLRLLRRHYPRCNAIVPVSRGAARAFAQLTGIPQDRLTPIPNPVVIPSLLARAAQPVDHPWFDQQSIPVVIWVGRLEPPKNVGLLLDAFDLLRAHIRCRLAIVGRGSEESALKIRAQASPYHDDIAFLGYQDNPYRFIRCSTVLALSSNWEGFGNVLVEAMALGIPAVSTNCPSGPAEILEDGRLGPLIPVGDAAAMAEGIKRCLHDPIPPAVLIDAAQQYRSDRVAQRYLELLQDTA
jgi:glycosyltransferase involved in cell wall biosynthesis